MALTIAKISNRKVKFDLPTNIELKGYNPITYSVLNTSKLESLGFCGQYDLEKGYTNTIKVLKQIRNKIK